MIERLVMFSAHQRLVSALLVVLMLAGGVYGALQLEIDTSYDSLISENDPGKDDYDRTIQLFGSDNTTVVSVRDDDLFNPKKLRVLEDTVVALKEIQAVDGVDSLFSVVSIRDRSGVLDSRPLMDIAPETEEQARKIQDDAVYSPLIRNNLLSKDGKVTAINITVVRDRTNPRFNLEVFNEIEQRIKPLRDTFDEVFQVGPPRLNVEIERGMFADLSVLTPFSTAVLIGFVILMMRLPIAAALPMVTAGTSILLTFGFMGLIGLKLTLLTAIVPSLIIVIGSTEDMHLVASYLEGLPGKGKGKGDRVSAVRVMVHHAGVAIILSSFTTAVGFLSNGVNDIPLIRDFAIASAFGMAINFVVTILVVPSMLSLFGPRTNPLHKEGQEQAKGIVGVITGVVEIAVERYGKWVAIGTTVVVVIFAGMATKVHVSNDPLSYFDSAHPLVQEAEKLHGSLSGMQIFYLTLRSETPEAFREPENLKALANIEKLLNDLGAFDKTISLADHLSLVNQEMHNGDAAKWSVPDNRNLVDQYLLLFQRSDLERYVTSDYTAANIVVRHNISNSHILNQHLDKVVAAVPELLPPGITFTLTGENLMINRAAEGLFSGQVESLILIGGIVFVLMSILYTSVFSGFMFLIPNLLPLVLNFGMMGILGIPLNPGTASVAAIALGIAVDDSIHLFARYRSEVKLVGDPDIAVRNTIRGESVAVITTSLSLMAMYATLLVSEFAIVVQFGMLAGLTMVYALYADLLITPMVLRKVGVIGVFEMASLKLADGLLKDSPLFTGMTRSQIKKTILLSKRAEFAKADNIINVGESGKEMFVVLSGAADVVVEEAGVEKTIRRLTPGQVFGEIGFLGESKRVATVRAWTDTEVLVLEAEAVRKGLRFHPGIAKKLNANITAILTSRVTQQAREDAMREAIEQDKGDAEGKVLELRFGDATARIDSDTPIMTVGRGKSCNIQLGGAQVSRSHATIRMTNGRFFITDHSTNGVFLGDGRMVKALHWETGELVGGGTIGLGQKPVDGGENTLAYRLMWREPSS